MTDDHTMHVEARRQRLQEILEAELTPGDWEYLKGHDAKVRQRGAVERAIVRRLVAELMTGGYYIKIQDPDEGTWLECRTLGDAMPNLQVADEERFNVYTQDGKCAGQMFLVFGNDGWDVICDYSTSLETSIAQTNAFADKLSELV